MLAVVHVDRAIASFALLIFVTTDVRLVGHERRSTCLGNRLHAPRTKNIDVIPWIDVNVKCAKCAGHGRCLKRTAPLLPYQA